MLEDEVHSDSPVYLVQQVETGKYNTLEVIKEVDFGVFLDGDEAGNILMPSRYVPKGTKVGDELDVFIYRDSEDRLIATNETPKIKVGECALLEVKAVNNVGAFLDWGLPKDLLVPKSQQAQAMRQGQSYVVHAYVDDQTDRIAATSKLSLFLKETGIYFKAGQKVDLLIASRSDLGYKAVINDTHLGLLFHSDLKGELKIGEKMPGFIRRVRDDDQRIDLGVEQQPAVTRKDLNTTILEFLKENGGASALTDKSPPEDIFKQFGVSKGSYKKALGALYKLKKIKISKDKVELL